MYGCFAMFLFVVAFLNYTHCFSTTKTLSFEKNPLHLAGHKLEPLFLRSPQFILLELSVWSGNFHPLQPDIACGGFRNLLRISNVITQAAYTEEENKQHKLVIPGCLKHILTPIIPGTSQQIPFVLTGNFNMPSSFPSCVQGTWNRTKCS